MPTYYSCGTLESEYPSDDEIHLSFDCGCSTDNEYEDEDEDDVNVHAATLAAERVSMMVDADLPDMRVPNVRRFVSCEWEGSDGVRVAHQACQFLNPSGTAAEYHGDGTCDGEVVFGYLALWQDDAAERYARSCAVIDELRTMGEIRVGFNAGHHIHVGAKYQSTGRGLSPNNLVSLYSVFAHTEDLLYRLASAGWSQHRCEQDGSYSSPMLKLGSGRRTPRSIGNTIGHERYQGLNVTPYVESMTHCRCGAYRFGEWESCECSDDGKTIEWRLWNASVSPRKIRAYIAISAVLTEYAANVDVRDVSELDEYPFQGTGTVDEQSLLVQLDYLTSRPGFTKRDRADIRWLASIAPGMGDLGTEYRASRGSSLSYEYDASPVVA